MTPPIDKLDDKDEFEQEECRFIVFLRDLAFEEALLKELAEGTTHV